MCRRCRRTSGQTRRVRSSRPCAREIRRHAVSSLSRSRPRSSSSCRVASLDVSAHTIPTDAPESDGTLEWDSTTIVVVRAHAGGEVGLGYTYTHDAAARLIEDVLAPAVRGFDLGKDTSSVWHEMGD